MENKDDIPAEIPAKKVTMRDVAKAAHVATSTVSRALNRPGRTSPYTAEYVFRIARELGYINGNQLHEHSPLTKRFAVVADVRNTPLISALKSAASSLKYQLVFIDSQIPLPDLGAACNVISPLADGFLLDNEKTKLELNALVERRPVMWINRDSSKYDVVLPDVSSGIKDIIQYLKTRRRSSFAYLHTAGQGWISDECLKTVIKFSKRNQIRLHLIEGVENTIESGFKSQARWRRRTYSNVLIFGSLAAVGFVQALQQRDSSTLENVSILCIGEAQSGLLSTPTISTLEIPYERVAQTALRRLSEKVQDGQPNKLQHEVKEIPALLIRRETTKNWR